MRDLILSAAAVVSPLGRRPPTVLTLCLAAAVICCFALAPARSADAPEKAADSKAAAEGAAKIQLVDGDSVVLLGSAFTERDQQYGYLEAALLSHFPGRKVTVRNLGRSGDTVWGDAWAGFGTVADGFTTRQALVAEAKPTVVLVAFGANEAFAGPDELDRFRDGLKTLLDALATTSARIVLVSPLRQEDLGRPLPDPTAHNEALLLYKNAIAELASQRQLPFANLFDGIMLNEFSPPGVRLTDNGIHLTAAGYWRATPRIMSALGLEDDPWLVEIDGGAAKAIKTVGTEVLEISRTDQSVRFRLRDQIVPPARPPAEASELAQANRAGRRVLRATNLAGSWTLKIDGKKIDTFSADDWSIGIVGIDGPEVDQADRLRRQIVAKDELFFARSRPENEIYLFGTRKHEQGNNAEEIPKFDPLIHSKDARIQQLTLPVEHEYELIEQ